MVDFTRVLAGPTCGRLLAEQGADVTRIDNPLYPDLISYRLDAHYQQRLEAMAVRNGISQHEQARRLLVESLNGANGQEQVLEQIAGLRQDVDRKSTRLNSSH